jgi:hypothetical protein
MISSCSVLHLRCSRISKSYCQSWYEGVNMDQQLPPSASLCERRTCTEHALWYVQYRELK